MVRVQAERLLHVRAHRQCQWGGDDSCPFSPAFPDLMALESRLGHVVDPSRSHDAPNRRDPANGAAE